MRSQTRPIFIALGSSLIVHAILLSVLLAEYRRDLENLLQGAIAHWPQWELIGESTGRGDSTHEQNSDGIFVGLPGTQTQAALSRDSQGPGDPMDLPAETSLGSAAPRWRELPAMSPPNSGPSLEELREAVTASALMPASPASLAPPEPQPSQQGTGTSRTAPDPAPMAETESDPFSDNGSVIVRGGKLDVRLGRKAKIVRPRLDLAAKGDLLSMSDPKVKMLVTIDDTGKVKTVEILESSGSDSLDIIVRLAAYESWFEPQKDGSGKLKHNPFAFTVRYSTF